MAMLLYYFKAKDTIIKFFVFSIIFICPFILCAQNLVYKGQVLDESKNPVSFVTVLVYEGEEDEPIDGTITDADGRFAIEGLEAKEYKLTLTYVGFEDTTLNINAGENSTSGLIILKQSFESLNETVVTAKRPTVQKKPDMLIFNVENSSLSTGSTFELLKKTPGLVIIGDKIKIKTSTPIIYINGKRVYLSSAEVTSLLQNTDASIIKSVEVITNPSSKYDAESGVVLNIVTSKAISIGYKGSVNARYEQAIYPKYSFGTSQFYKNDWVNFYGSYSFSPRTEYKEDDNFTKFFNPDGSTKSIWNTDFSRTTRSKDHQANVVFDFTLDKNQTLSLSSNISVTPNQLYDNTGYGEIADAMMRLDSTFSTLSKVNTDKHNLSFNLDYKYLINDNGDNVVLSGNYINYSNKRDQDVRTKYFSPVGDLLRLNSFITYAAQATDIITGQVDLTHGFWKGSFEGGLKYSDIDTESKLDFFDTDLGSTQFNNLLSDDFNYRERIYAEYVNFTQGFGKWNVNAGLRGEYTYIESNSRSLGQLDTQDYFELFPSGFVQYKINDDNSVALTYARSITRPRYQSLNPFKYFINENNFETGNPFLVPAIDDKIALSYDYKGLNIKAYYQYIHNQLQDLVFQDNNNQTLRNSDANLISNFQYSIDVNYYGEATPWLYLALQTSSFYLENEFYAVESAPLTYKNHTLGFYGFLGSYFTLKNDGSITADLSIFYFSDYIFGSAHFKNQSYVSLSFQQSFWKNTASISLGVDDIFDTNNVLVTSKYYNQDNNYFAKAESRLFRLGLRYTFGNARLRDNNRNTATDEGERIK